MIISPLNLKKKTLGIILGISIATVAAMFACVFILIKPQLETKLIKRGESIAHAISFQCINPILARNYFQLDLFFREFMGSEHGVEYIYVLGTDGEVTAHSFGRDFPVELKKLAGRIDAEGHSMARIIVADKDIIDISMPLLDGNLGRLHVGMATTTIRNDVNEIVGSFIGVAALYISSSLLIMLFLSRWIIKPIAEFTVTVESVGEGDLDRRLTVRDRDEIGVLAEGFNRMLDSIKESRATLLQEKELLSASEERFRKIIEQSPVSMALVSMDGTIEYINHWAVATFGYRGEEIPDMQTWWSVAYPDAAYRREVVSQWMGLLEKAVASNREIERRVYKVTCKDGTLKDVEIFGVLVASKVFVIFEDITGQKLAEESLRESTNRYQLFTSITSDYVYECSRRGGEPFRVKWMAGAVEQITGYSMEDMYQMTCWEAIVHPDDRQRVSSFLLALVPEERSTIEFRILTKGGEVCWIHESSYCKAGAYPDELYHYGSSQDISVRKHAEIEIQRLNNDLEKLVAERTVDLRRSNRDLASFCYAISHELRAPVARLKGLSQALQEELIESPENAAHCAQRIEVASSELQRVINSVLQLSRLSKAALVPKPLDLSRLVREISDLLTAEVVDRELEIIIADDITASGDASLVRLCLENLLGNAVKYTARTQGARIEFGRDVGSGALFVKDNGIGFDMTHADNLFEPFTRLHQEEEFAGSGIGLATVQRIIERHGGKIWAESSPGHGATFFFTLGAISGDSHAA